MANVVEMPFQILLEIFKLAEYNERIPCLLEKEASISWPTNRYFNLLPHAECLASKTKIRKTLRLVCKRFRDLIDSASFWRNKTMIISSSLKASMLKGLQAYLSKCSVTSLEVTANQMMVDRTAAGIFNNLKNLKQLSLNFTDGFVQPNILRSFQNCKLESLEISVKISGSLFHKTFHKLLPFLTSFAKCLRKFSFGYKAENDSCSLNSRDWLKLQSQNRNVEQNILEKLMTIFPNMESVVLKNLAVSSFVNSVYIGYTKKDDWSTVACLKMLQSLDIVCDKNGILVENFLVSDGHYYLTNVELPIFAEEFDKWKREAGILSQSLERLSFKSFTLLEFSSMIKNITTLRIIEIELFSSFSIRSETQKLIKKLQCFRNLEQLALIGFQALINEDIILLSNSIGHSLRKLKLANCQQLTDSCLFHLRRNFQNLDFLDVSQCHGLNLTFLIQNYDNSDPLPKIKTIVLSGLVNKTGSFMNIIKTVRTSTKNKLQIIF